MRLDRARAFPIEMLGDDTEEAFERRFGATVLTHADLLRFAAAADRAGRAPRREGWS